MKRSLHASATLALASVSLLALVGGCAPEPTTEAQAALDAVGEAVDHPPVLHAIEAEMDETGALHFPSSEAFFAALDTLNAMSPKQIDAWEDSLGFVSARRLFDKVMDAAGRAETEEEADAILLSHPETVRVEGDLALPVIGAPGYAAVVGPEGVFFVADTVHKVLSEVIVSAEGGQRAALDEALAQLEASEPIEDMVELADGVRAVRYDMTDQPKGRTGGCMASRNAFYNTSDRKVDFTIRTYRYYCAGCCGQYFYSVRVSWTLVGYKKWLGKWKSYKTSYNHRNVGYEIQAPVVTGYNGVSSIFHYGTFAHSFSPGESGGDYNSWTVGLQVGNTVQNASIAVPAFDKVKGQGKSRGTGANGWANICCGYAGGCGF